MIKFERTSVMNFENAMRGARNPMNSWGRMDSSYDEDGNFVFGPNDLDLAKRLRMAGSDHRKFIRQIFVSVDITAPLYWWNMTPTKWRLLQTPQAPCIKSTPSRSTSMISAMTI